MAEAFAITGLVLALPPLLSALNTIITKIKDFKRDLPYAESDLGWLSSDLESFLGYIQQTEIQMEELESVCPASSSERQAFEKTTVGAKVLVNAINLLFDQIWEANPRIEKSFFSKIVIAIANWRMTQEWKHCRPRISVLRLCLVSQKVSLLLTVSIYQLRLCQKQLAEQQSQPQVSNAAERRARIRIIAIRRTRLKRQIEYAMEQRDELKYKIQQEAVLAPLEAKRVSLTQETTRSVKKIVRREVEHLDHGFERLQNTQTFYRAYDTPPLAPTSTNYSLATYSTTSSSDVESELEPDLRPSADLEINRSNISDEGPYRNLFNPGMSMRLQDIRDRTTQSDSLQPQQAAADVEAGTSHDSMGQSSGSAQSRDGIRIYDENHQIDWEQYDLGSSRHDHLRPADGKGKGRVD